MSAAVERRWTEHAVRALSVAALLAYAAIALETTRRWWLSGLAAVVVAGLLLFRHRRARFSAYVLWTVVAARGLLGGWWPLALMAAGAVLILQTPPALRLWPRINTPGTRRDIAPPVD